MSDAIQNILNQRREVPRAAEVDGDKFFSYLLGDGVTLHFFEIQKRDGSKLSLSYSSLNWFFYDADEQCIEADFNGVEIRIEGRGLADKLYSGIQQKRVAWVKEADSEMQDHKENEIFIANVIIKPPAAEEE